MRDENLITQSTVISMGWTKSMIEKLLPAPKEAPNPYYRKAAPMKLYNKEDVVKVMDSEEYKTAYEKYQKRKASSQKAIETKTKNLQKQMDKFVESVTVEVINDSELVKETLRAKNNWAFAHKDYRHHHTTKNVDQDTLQRWAVNYIRHNLVDYDYGLYRMYGKTGKYELYASFKGAVLEKIAEAYPQYADECARQALEAGYFEF